MNATSEPNPTVARWWQWLEGSISGLVSLVLHIALMLILALMGYGAGEGDDQGDEVLIGVLPAELLSESSEMELTPAEASPAASEATRELEIPIAVAPAAPDAATSSADQLAIPSPSAGVGASGDGFDLGAVAIGGGGGGGGSWDGMLQTLRRNGLEIVITFDSTGSMSGEINEVKRQIERISKVLVKMVPKTRISICTYRDTGDEYLVKGLPLTGDMQAVDAYLRRIDAGGGGDHPEAVLAGLQWSVTKNQFRPQARKVILLFGDAPPHNSDFRECLTVAGEFQRQQRGVVSTVTCRDPNRMREFVDIAYAGGGESFLTTDERQIVTQLMVLVFGSQFRSKVVEAFRLLE